MTQKPIYNVSKRYDAILQAGEALLCESYENAQPPLITKRAKVSVGLFYRYFDNKQALLAAIMERHLNTLHGQIRVEIDKYNNAIDALQFCLSTTLSYFREHQGLIKLFFMEIGYGDQNTMQQLLKSRQAYRDILMEIINKGIKQKFFLDQRTLDIEIAVNALVGTINWSLYNILVVQKKTINSDVLATRILNFFLRSLTRG